MAIRKTFEPIVKQVIVKNRPSKEAIENFQGILQEICERKVDQELKTKVS